MSSRNAHTRFHDGEQAAKYYGQLQKSSRVVLFGFTEKQIATFGMSFGIAGFMLYMLFIIFKLARDSKAGRTGTFVLFFVLAFGMFGFVAKALIQKLLNL